VHDAFIQAALAARRQSRRLARPRGRRATAWRAASRPQGRAPRRPSRRCASQPSGYRRPIQEGGGGGGHLHAHIYTNTYMCLDSIYYVSILIYTYTNNRHTLSIWGSLTRVDPSFQYSKRRTSSSG